MARKRTSTPTKPDDARAHRSIEALRAALLGLLEDKAFDEITIRDITDRAGVSYPTFFRRFHSKEELLESIAAGEVRRVLGLGQKALEQPMGGAHLCADIQAHRKLWKTLLTGGAELAMRREFARISREIADSRPRTNPWLPLELATAFSTSGIFEILAWWMRQPEHYPVANVVKLFDALIIDAVGRPKSIALEQIDSEKPAGKAAKAPRAQPRPG